MFTFPNKNYQYTIIAALKAHFPAIYLTLPPQKKKKSRNSVCIAGTKNTSKSHRCFKSCSTLCSVLQEEDKAPNTSCAERFIEQGGEADQKPLQEKNPKHPQQLKRQRQLRTTWKKGDSEGSNLKTVI